MIILKADDWDTRGEIFRSHVYICKANNVDFSCLPLPCALRWDVFAESVKCTGASV
jgi:hypothetical protein